MAIRPVHDAARLRPPTDAAVELRGVTRLFGTVPAAVRVDLQLQRGEVALLRGPNGAGKSTLLRILATAIRPTYGEGLVLGHDLLRERAAIRARAEMLGHRTRLYDDLTAEENLRFTCRLHHLAVDDVPAVLGRVGLSTVAGERVRGFSHGMRQRLAAARMLLRCPDLLLLDEPYAGLDAEGRALVEAQTRSTADAGGVVVLATHDAAPGVVPDRILTMAAGRLREDAS